MSTLAEIEAAADTLTEEEAEHLLRHLTARLRQERPLPGAHLTYGSKLEDILAEKATGKDRRTLTPEEIAAILEKASGVSVSGMTTDEHMALMRGEE